MAGCSAATHWEYESLKMDRSAMHEKVIMMYFWKLVK
jgi:hypothetical protein